MQKTNSVLKIKILKTSEIKELREELHNLQDCICPICKEVIPYCDTTLDHQHVYKGEELGENGAGLIRGVLCFRCNSFEGIVLNKYKRQGLHKNGIEYLDLLKNLIKYLEQDNLPILHPSEKPKSKKIGKRLFQKIAKLYKIKYPKRKELVFPKTGILTKQLEQLLEEFGLETS